MEGESINTADRDDTLRHLSLKSKNSDTRQVNEHWHNQLNLHY